MAMQQSNDKMLIQSQLKRKTVWSPLIPYHSMQEKINQLKNQA